MSIVRISHSTIKQLTSCPRKVLFEKELRLFPVNGSIAMRYGSGFHKGMEAYYKNGKSITHALEAAAEYWRKPTLQQYEEDYRNLESLLNSLMLYHDQYQNDNETVAGIPENKIVSRLSLTDEEKEIYGDFEVDFVIVIDLILTVEGMRWVVDFKTTSVELAYMASRMRKMVQLMGYQFVAHDHFSDVNGCLVYYHQLKATKSRTTGNYGAHKTDFMKFPMVFTRHEYTNWRAYVIWHAHQLKLAKAAGYPPNYNNCYEFSKSCPYLPLCEHPKWDTDRFMEMDGFVYVPEDTEVKIVSD